MFKKFSLFTLLMLTIPLVVWATGWHWTGDQNLIAALDYPLYFLTETGSTPYALISCVVLMLWLIWLAKKRYSWLFVGAICAISVGGTQAVKMVAKNVFAEPRPYVEQMMGEHSEQFYELTRPQRAELVANYYQQSAYPRIAKHRQHETGYSFPSGHTIFAVSWLLVFAGILFQMRGKAVIFSQFLLLGYSALMLISRLRLGMHYPIDLFASTLIAWGFHLALFIWIAPKLQYWKWFKKRG